jgi:hypothetical protein
MDEQTDDAVDAEFHLMGTKQAPPSVAPAPWYERHATVLKWVLLFAIVALGAGLRIARLGHDSLSFDDQWHLELASGRGSPHVRLPNNVLIHNAPAVTSLVGAPPIHAIWTNMDFVVHPPLYYVCLRLWCEIFGTSDNAARSYSIVCTLLAIALLFIAAERHSGLFIGFWAALIWAVAPTQVFMAHQVREYDQLAALGMAAVLLLTSIERNPRARPWHFAGLGLCVLAMMLTHYFAIGACAAMGVYVLIRFRDTYKWKMLTTLAAAAVIYLIIWGPFLYRQRTYFAETADTWLMETGPDHLGNTFGRLASWPWWMIIRDGANSRIPVLSGILLLATPFLAWKRRDLLVWACWLGGTLLFIAFLDLYRGTAHLRFTRYVSLGAPAVFVLFVGGMRMFPLRLRHIPPLLVVLAALSMSRTAYISDDAGDWRILGRVLDKYSKPDEVLFFSSGGVSKWWREVLYLGASHYSHHFPRTIVKLDGPVPQKILDEFPGQTAWLISGPLQRSAPNAPPQMQAPPELVIQLVPGAEVLEQVVIPNIAVCTRVRLRTKDQLGTIPRN